MGVVRGGGFVEEVGACERAHYPHYFTREISVSEEEGDVRCLYRFRFLLASLLTEKALIDIESRGEGFRINAAAGGRYLLEHTHVDRCSNGGVLRCLHRIQSVRKTPLFTSVYFAIRTNLSGLEV